MTWNNICYGASQDGRCGTQDGRRGTQDGRYGTIMDPSQGLSWSLGAVYIDVSFF